MRVADLVVHRRTLTLRTPLTTVARKRTVAARTTLVELVTDDGPGGWGEAAPPGVADEETTSGIDSALTGPLRALVRGRRLRDGEDLADILAAAARVAPAAVSARTGLDIAMHDLLARQAGVPFHEAFGGSRLDIETSVTVGLGAPAQTASAAGRLALAGFTVLKIKMGGAPEEDLLRVRAVRDAVGPRVRLRLDANGGWHPQDAITVMASVEDEGLLVELVEQPVRADDIAGAAFVRKHIRTPVVADESVVSYADATEVIDRQAADVLNVKLQKNGGLTGTLPIVALAEDAGLRCMVGCGLETGIAVTAAASAVATRDAVPYADLDAPLLLARSPVIGGAEYDGPRIRLPRQPGLAVHGLHG